MKRKYEKTHSSSLRNPQSEHTFNIDHSFIQKFKLRIQSDCHELKNLYATITRNLKEKEENLNQNKDSLKYLKKENEDLHKKLSDYQ